MWQTWHRMALAATAGGMMLAGAAAVLANNGDTPKPEDYDLDPDTPLIEILDSGFNPSSCLIPRHESVHWVNSTDEPQRVRGEHNAHLDTGVLQPGEVTSGGFRFDFIGSVPFYLESDESVTGYVRTDQPLNCAPQPPTPTPTNTPTITPTPTNTPSPTSTPTMIPTPDGQQGHVPQIAREAGYPY